ncbi:hypothetical protein GCM10022247_06290 [Allokutzneria multivorans]|uniref:Knr4/Smi1-like domain-containing protein n=1 Tax=Allokutzneria multivorans TaxID=1142134 RepID=A0ABP7R0U3_9PSEU
MSDLAESWRLIDAWLARNAPSELALLNPPATPGEIQAAERALGARLPAELTESLLCHNGMSAWTTIFPEQSPLSVSGLVQQWRTCMDIAGENDGLTARPWDEQPWWHPLWVPWAGSAGGSVQVIDLRPGPGEGRLGWAGHGGGGDFTDSWPDLASLLRAVARALHEGGDVRGLWPYLAADGALWWDEQGSVELDGRPLTIAPRSGVY